MLKASLAKSGRGAPGVWWLNPSRIIWFVIIPGFNVAYFAPMVVDAAELARKGSIYFDWYAYVLGMAFLGTLGVSTLVASSMKSPTSSGIPYLKRPEPLFLDVLFFLTLAAYAIWFHPILLDPPLAYKILIGEGGSAFQVRRDAPTVPGLTTMTQFGVAFVVMYYAQIWGRGVPFKQKRFGWYCGVIVALSVFRSFAWAERLAAIEVIVPAVVLYVAFRVNQQRDWKRILVMVAPVLGVLGLLSVFAGTEALRSWTFYRTQGHDFWGFMVARLGSYYFTALNNGAGLLSMTDWPTWTGAHTLDWLYKFPLGVGDWLKGQSPPSQIHIFLENYADPEFNNLSGVFTPFHDFGVALGLVIAVAWGGIVGAAYRGFVHRRGLGLYVYPVVFISLLESLRIFYLGSSRLFPVLVALMASFWIFQVSPHSRTGRSETSDPRRGNRLSSKGT